MPDGCDPDDDNDGLSDADEATKHTNPLNPDTDGDNWSDGSEDPDLIDQGSESPVPAVGYPIASPVLAGPDNCPLTHNADQADFEHDNIGDACDPDDDNDGHADTEDVFPHEPTEWADADHDGTGDNADTDDDNDGVPDVRDNCHSVHNTAQGDVDGDGAGDACDPDADSDGLTAADENAAGTDPLLGDTDTDLISDGPGDPDGSGPVHSGPDNCPTRPNPSQADFDRDGKGDVCDPASSLQAQSLFPPGNPGRAALSILVAGQRQALGKAIANGVKVTGYCSSACTLTVAAFLERRGRRGHLGLGARLGSHTVRLTNRGHKLLRISITRAVRSKLRRTGRRVHIRLLATARAAGGASARQLRTVVLVRR